LALETKLIATIPVYDEDAKAETTIHVRFPDLTAYGEFLEGLTAEEFDTSGVVIHEVPTTWECSGIDNCMVMA
jgi:hypothetical protein